MQGGLLRVDDVPLRSGSRVREVATQELAWKDLSSSGQATSQQANDDLSGRCNPWGE